MSGSLQDEGGVPSTGNPALTSEAQDEGGEALSSQP